MKKTILISIGIICFIGVIGSTYKLFFYQEIFTNNIAIGIDSGKNLTIGEYNIFLGDYAGENETTINNTLIIKSKVGEIRKQITKKQWNNFNEMIQGAVFYYTTTTVNFVSSTDANVELYYYQTTLNFVSDTDVKYYFGITKDNMTNEFYIDFAPETNIPKILLTEEQFNIISEASLHACDYLK